MKLTKMVYTLLFTSILANAAFATTAPQKWSINGAQTQLMVRNDSDQARYFAVTTASRRIIGGDVVVTANAVSLRCEPSLLARLLLPGQSGKCIVGPRASAIITMLPRPASNWGAEGTYNFEAIAKQ